MTDDFTPEQAADEMRVGLLALSTAYEALTGSLTAEQAGAVLASAIHDAFEPDEAVAAIWGVCAAALRALQLAADALGTDVPALLARLGVEAAGPPAG